MDMEKKIMERATGETRLNPDEQRYYMGTFGERVLLTASSDDASNPKLQEAFAAILTQYSKTYTPLTLKLSSQLKDGAEITYLKLAKDKHIPATIVTEDKANSPFGLVLHTNRAENIETTDVRQVFPDIFEETTQATTKKSFWQKLFGG